MGSLDGCLPGLGAEGMMMVRFAAKDDDVGPWSAAATTPSTLSQRTTSCMASLSPRLPVRSLPLPGLSGCRPRVIRQDGLGQSLDGLTAQAVEDTGRDHARFIPHGHTGQGKGRIAQAAELALDVIGRCRPLANRFGLEIGYSRGGMAIFIPQGQAQVPWSSVSTWP